MRRYFAVALALALVLVHGRSASAQAPPVVTRGRSTCDVCHNELEFLRQNTDSMARAHAVFVADSMIAGSAHAKLSCTSCHPGFVRFPHRTGLKIELIYWILKPKRRNIQPAIHFQTPRIQPGGGAF